MSDDDWLRFGARVIKDSGDYKFEGTVVSVFQKLSGATRAVVENDDGILHVFSRGQLRRVSE